MSAFSRSPFRLPIVSIACLLLILLITNVYGRIHSNDVLADVTLEGRAKVDVKVYIPFEPERFHLEQFQKAGRYLGWQGDHAIIMQAKPEALIQLARKYWIVKILPLEDKT